VGAVDAALSRVHDEGGALDVAVNNAGISPFAAVEDQRMDEARLTLETNLLGPMRRHRAAGTWPGWARPVSLMADLYRNQTPTELYDTLHGFYELP